MGTQTRTTNMKTLRYLRNEITVGRHLNTCHPSPEVRALGWKRMQDARRIARRLRLDARSLPQV
jgi:hypothetical protein